MRGVIALRNQRRGLGHLQQGREGIVPALCPIGITQKEKRMMEKPSTPEAIDLALEKLYQGSRSDLAELFSAACDPGGCIFSDSNVPKRLVAAGLLSQERAVPPATAAAVQRKFRWTG